MRTIYLLPLLLLLLLHAAVTGARKVTRQGGGGGSGSGSGSGSNSGSGSVSGSGSGSRSGSGSGSSERREKRSSKTRRSKQTTTVPAATTANTAPTSTSTSTIASTPTPVAGVCTGFFTVLAEREPWRTKGAEPCADSFGKLDPLFRVLSAQMTAMGETLTVFSSYLPDAIDANSCSLGYPGIKLVQFDAEALMLEYKLGEVMDFFRQYSLTEYTRVSDVLRLLLAHKHGLAYIDPDVHFLDNDSSRFMKEFVGAAVWSEVITYNNL
jgi:hypothetical protein